MFDLIRISDRKFITREPSSFYLEYIEGPVGKFYNWCSFLPSRFYTAYFRLRSAAARSLSARYAFDFSYYSELSCANHFALRSRSIPWKAPQFRYQGRRRIFERQLCRLSRRAIRNREHRYLQQLQASLSTDIFVAVQARQILTNNLVSASDPDYINVLNYAALDFPDTVTRLFSPSANSSSNELRDTGGCVDRRKSPLLLSPTAFVPDFFHLFRLHHLLLNAWMFLL